MSAVLDHLLEPFDYLLADPSLEDIAVNGPDNIWVYAKGAWTRQDLSLDADDIEDIAIVAAAQRRQDIHYNRPLLSTDLKGRGRLQGIVYPCVPEERPCIVIRRGSGAWPTLAELAEHGIFAETQSERPQQKDDELLNLYRNRQWEEFLRLAIKKGKTVLGCGVTGSGKTHLSKGLIAEIPTHERVVSIEDAPELIGLDVVIPNSVQLFYDKDGKGTKAADLVDASLRMRPDRVILQEIRDGQAALAFVLALQTGHKGITTIHADNCAGAFDRLRFVIKKDPAGAAIGDNDLMTQLKSLVDVVLHISLVDGQRKVDEVWFKAAH